MEVWSIRLDEIEFFPSRDYVNTTEWMHQIDATKTHSEKARWKLQKNTTRYFDKSLKQNPTKQQLYGHLPPISQTTQVKLTKHAENCWRSKDELMINILWWTLTHGSQRVFLTTPCVRTEMILLSSCWSANTGMCMWRGPWENIAYKFVLTSPVESRVSCLSYLDGYRDRR